MRAFLRKLNQKIGSGLIFDLFMHLKRLVCVIARRHVGATPEIGILTKKGFRGGVVVQCRFCHEIKFSKDANAVAFGGKR